MKSPSSMGTYEGNTAILENMHFRFSSGKGPVSFHFAGRSVQRHGAGFFPQGPDSMLDGACIRLKSEPVRSAFRLGRFQLNEGIAAAWMDGLHNRTDISDNTRMTLFAGRPVNSRSVDLVGGMLSRNVGDRYTVGISYLKESGPELFREEAGIDLRMQPHKRFALSGRSRLNLETDGWLSHSYSARLGPFRKFSLFSDVSLVDYGAFSHSFPGTELTVGGRVVYPISRHLIVGVNTRESDGPAGESVSHGLRVSYMSPEKWNTAVFANRSRGNAGMNHVQTGVDVKKTIGKLAASLGLEISSDDGDLFGVNHSYSEVLRITWELSPAYRLAADLRHARNAFSAEARGFLKLEYRFKI